MDFRNHRESINNQTSSSHPLYGIKRKRDHREPINNHQLYGIKRNHREPINNTPFSHHHQTPFSHQLYDHREPINNQTSFTHPLYGIKRNHREPINNTPFSHQLYDHHEPINNQTPFSPPLTKRDRHQTPFSHHQLYGINRDHREPINNQTSHPLYRIKRDHHQTSPFSHQLYRESINNQNPFSHQLNQTSFSHQLYRIKRDHRESINNQTSFSLQLTKHVMQQHKECNLVISPLSIHVLLCLIACRSEGEALYRLLSFLRAQTTDDLNSLSSQLIASVLADGSHLGGPKTSCANSVWNQYDVPLKPSFLDIVTNIYKASINQVDFKTKADEIINEVNSWAEKETNGLIKNVVDGNSVNSSTRLILANALYFKGVWAEKFDKARTREYDFHLLNGASVQVPFMTSTQEQLLAEYHGFKVLQLLYKQGEDKRRLSMYFILPNAKHGLSALVDKVASEPEFLDCHRPNRYVPVGEFRIPKFKISFGFEALEVLNGLGLQLYDPEILHKSAIEVDEQGTEAAAVSVTVISCSMGMPEPIAPIDFVADHPFMFLIREDMTGVVVFTGHVLNPSLSS